MAQAALHDPRAVGRERPAGRVEHDGLAVQQEPGDLGLAEAAATFVHRIPPGAVRSVCTDADDARGIRGGTALLACYAGPAVGS